MLTLSMRKKITLIITILTTTLFLTACTMNNVNQSNGNPQNQSSSSNAAANAAKVDMYDAAPEQMSAEELQGKIAIIKTSKGDITVELRGDKAPKTVSNFIFLAETKFYDSLKFHRRVEGFVIQGGDPAGNGTGGPGYTVPAEITDLKHNKGALATARTGDQVNPERASSGSQFYIVLEESEQNHMSLDDQYTVFGYVTSGMDVAAKIQVGDVINSIEIK